ncbi:MAG: DJ-1/PfpI family protein [Spirochaetaceae bacterium]|nr:DJ-1/PfpI family protein [Spirochaetaceae bacterium]
MAGIVIFLANGFEEVEAVTPADYLRRAGIDVVLVGVDSPKPTGARGISIIADIDIKELDWLPGGVILPGGLTGASNLAESEDVERICRDVMNAGGLVASICASPAIALGSFNLLKGREYTCYPGFEEKTADGLFSSHRVVVDGNLITSRGPGTAAEFSLEIIRYLTDDKTAERIAEAVLSV